MKDDELVAAAIGAGALLVLFALSCCTRLKVEHRTTADRKGSFILLEVGQGAAATATVGPCLPEGGAPYDANVDAGTPAVDGEAREQYRMYVPPAVPRNQFRFHEAVVDELSCRCSDVVWVPAGIWFEDV